MAWDLIIGVVVLAIGLYLVYKIIAGIVKLAVTVAAAIAIIVGVVLVLNFLGVIDADSTFDSLAGDLPDGEGLEDKALEYLDSSEDSESGTDSADGDSTTTVIINEDEADTDGLDPEANEEPSEEKDIFTDITGRVVDKIKDEVEDSVRKELIKRLEE